MSYANASVITVETFTEYFGKKHGIDKAIQYFKDNTSKYFVEVHVNWSDTINMNSGNEMLLIRREVLNHALGFDFVQMQGEEYQNLYPKNKDEYMTLWEGLKFQQPKAKQ